MQSQISGRGAHAPPRRTDRRAPRDRIPGARRVHQHHPTSHSWPDRATPVSTSSSPMAMIAPLASPPPSNLHQNPSPNRAASSAPSCVGAVGVGGCRRFGVSGRAVVPGSAWSYVGTRGRTPGRAVVPRGAQSYLRGALRYDRAGLRTTARLYVRPRRADDARRRNGARSPAPRAPPTGGAQASGAPPVSAHGTGMRSDGFHRHRPAHGRIEGSLSAGLHRPTARGPAARGAQTSGPGPRVIADRSGPER